MNELTTFKQYANRPEIIARVAEAWNTKETNARAIMSSVILKVANDKNLLACTPESIITSALRAASLRLHVDLDQAYLVPFKDKCTLITGYRGLYDLGIRTGQYRFINTAHTKQGTTIEFNPITGEALRLVKEEGAPAGVVSSFSLKNGFCKTIYWTLPEIHTHADKYSPSYNFKSSPWKTFTQKMELKTVFRALMLQWGIMSPFEREIIETEDDQANEKLIPLNNLQVGTTQEQFPTIKTKTALLAEMGY